MTPFGSPNPPRGLVRPALLVALLAALAACASTAPSSSPPASSTPTAATPTASPTPEASPTPSPTGAGVGDSCVADPPFEGGADWTRFTSDDGYTFLYPSDWVEVTGSDADTANRMSPELIAEVSAPDRVAVELFREPNDEPVFGPVFSVSHLDGATSSTDALFERELAWNQTQEALGFRELLEPRLETCIAGQPALGFVADWTDVVIAMFIWERDGAVYQAWVASEEPVDVDLGSAIFASWGWTEPTDGEPPDGQSSGAIAGAATATEPADTFDQLSG